MSFSRHTITFANVGATTETSGINSDGVNGEIYSVRYPYVATIPNTDQVTLYAGTTDKVICSLVALTTNPWTIYPRIAAVNSTNSSTSWGTSTQMDKHPVPHVVTTTEPIYGIIVGTAGAGTAATIEVTVRGH